MKQRLGVIDLKSQVFDILIIGGGINGAVSAASLTARGYRVALIDQGDFASQTSQASSNLVWGGIKYMENYEFSLVHKLCLSRNYLMKIFPNLIREVRFFLPIFNLQSNSSRATKNWKRHPLLLYLGMWLYWILGRCYTRIPKFFSSKFFSQIKVPLQPSLFRGALEYSDAYLPENDSRLVFRMIRKAEKNGATVVNYVKFIKSAEKGEFIHCTVKDQVNQQSFLVKTRFLVNATGPFLDKVNQGLKVATQHRHIFSKGVHLVFPKLFSHKKVISFFDEDDRLFFAIPMGPRTVVGTTDNRVKEPIAQVDDEDRAFLLRNINRFLTPEQRLSTEDIIAERCGVRPLVVESGFNNGENSWFHLSRKHVLEINDRVLSIFGGKLTDCINIGEEVAKNLGEKIQPSGTKVSKLSSQEVYGEESSTFRKAFEIKAQEHLTRIPELKKFIPLWWTRYGSDAEKILELLSQKKNIVEIFDSEYSDVELYYIIENEHVIHLDDLLRRRTKLQLIVKNDKLIEHPIIKKLSRRESY